MARQVTDEERERARLGGRWLAETRERHGYRTGTAFAEALGIRQGRLSSYELGLYQVEERVARRIAEVLGLSELEVWWGLRLPMPRDVQSEQAIVKWVMDRMPAPVVEAWGWATNPEVLEKATGLKPPGPPSDPRSTASSRRSVPRMSERRRHAPRDEENAS